MKHLELKKLVLIGASTGGPGQIEKILKSVPKLQNTSIIIAQHMVQNFMSSFANRLQSSSNNPVSVIQNKQRLQSANIYLCDGKTQLNSQNNSEFSRSPANNNSYNPDINILFDSFIPLCSDAEILCIILTGIGNDGVEACQNLSQNGAKCLTESSKSAIVDGMPSHARAAVSNIEVGDINMITQKISAFCN
ncbi:MAG: chemotaxis protein CheB [Campylobacterota bacterium]|nr:chemotaxis protein CheB [Campylobacterota bacterium]